MISRFFGIVALASTALGQSALNILDFGAIPGDYSLDVCVSNGNAIQTALYAANASAESKQVLVPADNDFCIFKVEASYLYDVQFTIEGNLTFTNNMTYWLEVNGQNHDPVIDLSECHGCTVDGSGTVDGQGYDWWVWCMHGNEDLRPFLFKISLSTDIVVDGVTFSNSPSWTIVLDDVVGAHLKNGKVITNVEAQKELFIQFGHWDYKFNHPTYPLNTDGIDVMAKDVLIENFFIYNYDDGIAVKPSDQRDKYTTCTQNIVARNLTVVQSVGMSIGSVPPRTEINCVKDVVFDNIKMITPAKAIYVKSNPGTSGQGIIHNITYQNMYIEGAFWYPIWIGPQQQNQPDGTADTGCSFFYPIVDACPTNPLVTFSDITIRNVTFEKSVTMPGVILCDAANPCTGLDISYVTNNPIDGGYLVQDDYVCLNAQGKFEGNSPEFKC